MNKSYAEKRMKEVNPSLVVRMVTVTENGYRVYFSQNGKHRQKTVTTEEEFNEFLKTLND